MREVVSTGKTIDEAVQQALKELGVSREQVTMTVLDQGKIGIFGFGAKPATVRVKILKDIEIKEEKVEEPKVIQAEVIKEVETSINSFAEAEKFIKQMISDMNLEGVTVQVIRENEKYMRVILEGEKVGVLIGKHGQTLNSLQYLVQLVVNKQTDHYIHVELDAENYRERRKETLTILAKKLAVKVIRTGREVALEPMPSYERKVIHSALTNYHKVETHSSGTDPYRKVVIAPRKNNYHREERPR